MEARGSVRGQKDYFFEWPVVVLKMLLSRSLLRPNQCKIMQVIMQVTYPFSAALPAALSAAVSKHGCPARGFDDEQ